MTPIKNPPASRPSEAPGKQPGQDPGQREVRGDLVIGGGAAVIPTRPSVLPVYAVDASSGLRASTGILPGVHVHIGYIQRVGSSFRLLATSGRLTGLGGPDYPTNRRDAAQILMDAWNRGARLVMADQIDAAGEPE